MPSYNSVTLIGHLTRDPETKETQSGQVTKFAIALNSIANGKDVVTYVDIVAFDKIGDVANKYLSKGDAVLISGRLSIQKYTDKDGIDRKATSVIANNLTMLGSAKSDGDNAKPVARATVKSKPVATATKRSRPPADEDDEEEMPF